MTKCSPQQRAVLTFGNDLLHGDLVPPDGEAPANEIPACMTGPGGAAATSRTGPGAHQLATGIEELPHGAEATGGVFVASITHRETHEHAHTSEELASLSRRTDGNGTVKTVHSTNQTPHPAWLSPGTKHALVHLAATTMLRQPRSLYPSIRVRQISPIGFPTQASWWWLQRLRVSVM